MLTFLRWTGVIWGALLAFTVLALIVGQGHAAPDWTKLVSCHQPCWAGLNPDTNTAVSARRILATQPQFTLRSADNDTHGFEMSADNQRYGFRASPEAGIDMIVFRVVPQTPVFLGDVLVVFGAPSFYYHYQACKVNQCLDNIYLWFPQQRVEAIFQTNSASKLSLNSRLDVFTFGQPTVNLQRGCKWLGLVRLDALKECFLTENHPGSQ